MTDAGLHSRLRLRRRGERGHTLLEILVALGIFVFLGGALITFLNTGVSVWRLANTRGRLYERARAILDTAANDLRTMATDSDDEGPAFWVRLIADRDEDGRERVRFVRKLDAEVSDPIARHGGRYLAGAKSTHFDQQGDRDEVEAGTLLAPGGLQEVLYTMGPDLSQKTLWRGVRSPIGGVGSLFIDANINESAETSKSSRRRRTGTTKRKSDEKSPKSAAASAEKTDAEKTAAEKKGDDAPATDRLEKVARPLAGGVLYFGCRFWLPMTNTWDPFVPPLRQPSRTKRSGPAETWDSTRAILNTEVASKSGFAWRRIEGSIKNPNDDLFPERVEITVVLEGNPEITPITLERTISSKDTLIKLSSTVDLPSDGPFRHVRIGTEWIRYEAIEGDSISIGSKGARGARGTTAQKHDLGAPVLIGTSFRRIVEIPGYHLPIQEGRLERSSDRSNRRRISR